MKTLTLSLLLFVLAGANCIVTMNGMKNNADQEKISKSAKYHADKLQNQWKLMQDLELKRLYDEGILDKQGWPKEPELLQKSRNLVRPLTNEQILLQDMQELVKEGIKSLDKTKELPESLREKLWRRLEELVWNGDYFESDSSDSSSDSSDSSHEEYKYINARNSHVDLSIQMYELQKEMLEFQKKGEILPQQKIHEQLEIEKLLLHQIQELLGQMQESLNKNKVLSNQAVVLLTEPFEAIVWQAGRYKDLGICAMIVHPSNSITKLYNEKLSINRQGKNVSAN